MIPQVLGMMVIIAADRQRHTRRSYLELFGAIPGAAWRAVEPVVGEEEDEEIGFHWRELRKLRKLR